MKNKKRFRPNYVAFVTEILLNNLLKVHLFDVKYRKYQGINKILHTHFRAAKN